MLIRIILIMKIITRHISVFKESNDKLTCLTLNSSVAIYTLTLVSTDEIFTRSSIHTRIGITVIDI